MQKSIHTMPLSKNAITVLIISLLLMNFPSCQKQEILHDPDLTPLQDGMRVTSTVAYCASVAHSLFKGGPLPENVLIQTSGQDEGRASGLLLVSIDETCPIPFNHNTGQLWIACLWDPADRSGVISAVFTDIDIMEGNLELVSIYTIPVLEEEDGSVMTIFTEQDIVIGEGSDTLLHIGMSEYQFESELSRPGSSSPIPDDPFVAVKQHCWIVYMDADETPANVYDNRFTLHGGGQIAGSDSEGAGVLYHAMMGMEFIPEDCMQNPLKGTGFIQNLRAGEQLDLGHIYLNFHEACDGKAYVEFGHGKYWPYNHQYVNLDF